MVGTKYARLTIVEIIKSTGKHKYAICKCECGNQKTLRLDSVVSGNTKSCGCLHNEGNNTKHGLQKHPLYSIWNQMKQRCYNENEDSYERYGARGIKVCDEWFNEFFSFYTWCISNDWKKGMQIDRKENAGNYEPSNCRIVTAKVNSNNKRNNINLTYNGETKTLQQWCDYLKINRGTMIDRLFVNNWPIEKAFTQPVRKIKHATTK